ncbi:MAG: Stk1 family PASTA domain-containing Ser/Thr kinase [Clostridia bacterium]|nr:Stk1 family PASTA domain-containing Ser/Thr kinase [Clostridia bacterium]
MLKTGMIIAERYEIVSKIGTGGMADVYKAMDHKLNRFVAVKVLKPEFREDATFVKKFRSEAQAAAGLTHPNIVNVFDVGDDEGVYYIVMALIEGITLKEYISKKGKLSVKEATSIAIQVSMGLEAAHSHGIVHRDVKPQNIIISTDGKVKVTDFGIARAASSNTISSNVMGSVHYSSPEQVRGGYSDEKSDIYSLGITLYEMVTGRVPFDGDTTVAIAIKHLQEEMVPPSVYSPDLPYSLEQIILKCTQKSVDRRYNKMEDVIADLKHSLIDPQGDFVKLNSVDTDAKTVVISDEELGEIKHTPKQTIKPDIEALEKELNETNYDDDDYGYDDEDEKPERSRKSRERDREREDRERRIRKQKRGVSVAGSIVALIVGAVVLIAVILVVGRAAGLIGGSKDTTSDQQEQQAQNTDATQSSEDDSMVSAPDLIGKTEAEAQELCASLNIGMSYKGEEASTQEKGKISSQDPVKGTQIAKNSTINYYVSKGSEQITMPDLFGQNGATAQETLESQGVTVQINKIYPDDSSLVDIGCVLDTDPVAGSTVKAGDTVTLTISRGINYGDSVQIPDVTGLEKNEAIAKLGKFININVEMQMSTDVAEGTVISQDPIGFTDDNPVYGDPDQDTITLTVSSGNQDPSVSESTDESQVQSSAADTSVAAANGEVWKCTQRLNTPTGYTGGLIRLELVQEVNDEPKASSIVEGQQLTFPYQLDITGAPGVTEGTLYLSEQQSDGSYQELGHYPLTFEKAE